MAGNLKQTPIPVVPRTMRIVNPDGTVTRSGQLLLEQRQAQSAIQGTHANRPDPTSVPDGALYAESDRGVLYYNDAGVWHYLAGTMWGTLSPDQRPADLGVNDPGFDFRTSVSPARQFLWSQTAWIETTAAITAQNVVTGSRVADAVYPNTSNKPLYVSSCWNLAGNTSAMSARSDASNPPTTEVGRIANSSPQAETEQLFFPVLPGNYYMLHVLGGTVTLVSWVEYS